MNEKAQQWLKETEECSVTSLAGAIGIIAEANMYGFRSIKLNLNDGDGTLFIDGTKIGIEISSSDF